ncbi:MAG: twin-arginine translocation signal domain-containing protein, partial [Pseudomonadales bacterium]
MKNSRRNFIKGLAYTGGVLGYAASLPNVFAQAEYGGKLLITVQYRGAWDVSSFCDPKENVK